MTEPQANIADEKTIVKPGTKLPWANALMVLLSLFGISLEFLFEGAFSIKDISTILTLSVFAIANAFIVIERLNLKRRFGSSSFMIEDKKSLLFDESNGCLGILVLAVMIGIFAHSISSKFELRLSNIFNNWFFLYLLFFEYRSFRKEKRTLENLSEEDKGFLLAGKSIIF